MDIEDTWSVRRIDGRGLYISESAVVQIRKAIRIKQMLFKVNPEAPGFNFTMKPDKMDASVRRFELAFGGNRLQYSHGPKVRKTVQWPGDGSPDLRMVFEDLNNAIKRVNYEGPWAFFRLLSDPGTKISQSRRSSHYVTFQTLGRKATWIVIPESSINPFGDDALYTYRCPESL